MCRKRERGKVGGRGLVDWLVGWWVMKSSKVGEPSDDAEVGQFILYHARGLGIGIGRINANENLLEMYINNSNAFFNS